MNEQKQKEAMARLDGYTSTGEWPSGSPIWDTIVERDGFGCSGNTVVTIPDYNTDNEMDRMVRGLWQGGGIEPYAYMDALIDICGGCFCATNDCFCYMQTIPATPAQKREAFLKAKGVRV